MGLNITPTCYTFETTSSTWAEYIKTLEQHFTNTSSLWDVDNFVEDGSGNVGMTIRPVNVPTTFSSRYQINVRYDAGDGALWCAIDPDAEITDPNDPVNSGSREVSPESVQAGPSSPSFSISFLLGEFEDAIEVIWKDTNEQYTPNWLIAGAIHIPHFANDFEHNIDGLGWVGYQPAAGTGKYGEDGNGNSMSEARLPGGWDTQSIKLYDETYSVNPWSSTKIPAPHSIGSNPTGGSPRRALGTTKYTYAWHTQRGDNGLTILESDGGDGFLFMSRDGNAYNLIVPWDPTVSVI